MKAANFLMTYVFVIIFALQVLAQNNPNLNIEPPFWWTEMPMTELQLMVHGERIGDYRASLSYEGVTLDRQLVGDSPNYLFIYLTIEPGTKPGKLTFSLTKGEKDKKPMSFSYELLERKADPLANQGFDASDVIYLLMPDRFSNGDPTNDKVEGMLEGVNRSNPNARHGGDIKGIENNLEYIKELGMTAVWLTPVFENDMTPEYGAYHGYAATDMYKIDRRFGSNQEFKRFVEVCHRNDLKVIMDMIHNHIGDQHWWMKDLPTKDWVHDFEKYGQTNYRGQVQSDPYASQYDLDKLERGWFVAEMPDLNQHNPLVADYLIINTLWWIEYSGIDGIRMDTYVYPYKDYMAKWAKAVMEAYPDFNIVGEAWVETVAHEAYWQENLPGEGGEYNSYLPNVTDFQVYAALQKAFSEPFGWSNGLMQLYFVLTQDRLYSDPNKNVIFMENHDTERYFTTVKENKDHFKMAYAYLMTTRGIPQVYYGSELMFPMDKVPGDGAKRMDMPGGFPDDDRSVFTANGRTERENEAHAYVSKITNWRKGKEVIHSGKLLHFVPDNDVYVYFRHNDSETVMVVINNREAAATISRQKHIEMLRPYAQGHNPLTGETINISEDFDVPAKTATILELK